MPGLQDDTLTGREGRVTFDFDRIEVRGELERMEAQRFFRFRRYSESPATTPTTH